MKRLLPTLAVLATLAGCSTLPTGQPSVTAPPATPDAAWTKAVDGSRTTAWVRDGVAIPPLVFQQMKTADPRQMTVFMRSCNEDGSPMVKVEQLRGRDGRTRADLVAAMDGLREQEDNADSAAVLEYAFALGKPPMATNLTSTMRVFTPHATPLDVLLPAEAADAEQLFGAFPALAQPCPRYPDAPVADGLSLKDVVGLRLPADAAGLTEKSFGKNGAAAVEAFNELTDVLVAIRPPNHILAIRAVEDGVPRIAQASKWELGGKASLTVSLEANKGMWTLRAR